MIELLHEELTGAVRRAAYETYGYFGSGFLEKVYENALANRIRRKGWRLLQQVRHDVRDEDGSVVGDYVADMVVDRRVIVEVKALAALRGVHEAQMLNYLKATGIEVGLLINFGGPRLELRRLVYEASRHPSVYAGSRTYPAVSAFPASSASSADDSSAGMLGGF